MKTFKLLSFLIYYFIYFAWVKYFFDKGRRGAKGPSLPLKSLPTPDSPDALFLLSAGFYYCALILPGSFR